LNQLRSAEHAISLPITAWLPVNWLAFFYSPGESTLGDSQVVLLQELEQMKRCYGKGCARQCESVLKKLRHFRFTDTGSLIQAHDNLLFLRAFPQSFVVAKQADALLAQLQPEVERFLADPGAAEAFDDEAVSGIAGTTITNNWTYELARWLESKHGLKITAEWNTDEYYRQMATVLPNCLPLLADDSFVEADTPYLRWLEAAAGAASSDLAWLLGAFASLPVAPLHRTSLYDSLGINLHWRLDNSPASRTLARRPVSQIFVHRTPLLQRKQVSLNEEMNSAPLKLRKLDRPEAQSVVDMARAVLAVRYRELQGSTCADPDHAFQADVGRGVQLFIWGLAKDWRLPLRAYYAGFTVKNGLPVNYFEAIGLFEWMEVGFNTFYAFREGETAWIYSKVLHLLNQLAGVTCFSVYPYQIGQDNEEAIKSGAFWFYRKLGFRSGRPDLFALTLKEEQRMARDPNHRTSPKTLRKLAEGHMFFEFGQRPTGRWDSFSTRKLGLAVQREMATRFDGEAAKLRRRTTSLLCKQLGVNPKSWSPSEQKTLSDFALALSLTPGIASWTPGEKRALVCIIRAKAGRDETTYLRLLQRHDKLRDAFLRAGSDSISETP
jgi:hypothetical protein